MLIVCRKCEKPVPGVDIELARSLAVCRRCQQVIPLSGASVDEMTAAAALATHRPASLDWREPATDTGPVYRATSSPSRWGAIPLLIIAYFWCEFFVRWYRGIVHVLLQGGTLSDAGGPMFVLFPLIPASAGFFFVYEGLTRLFNRTTVIVDADEFRLVKRPIPQRGNIREPLANIERFLADEISGAEDSVIYPVLMSTRDGRIVRMFTYDNMLAARFVAGRLNEAFFRSGARRVAVTER